eukprot:5616108-Prorocentrum_lima.AAC.1
MVAVRQLCSEAGLEYVFVVIGREIECGDTGCVVLSWPGDCCCEHVSRYVFRHFYHPGTIRDE